MDNNLDSKIDSLLSIFPSSLDEGYCRYTNYSLHPILEYNDSPFHHKIKTFYENLRGYPYRIVTLLSKLSIEELKYFKNKVKERNIYDKFAHYWSDGALGWIEMRLKFMEDFMKVHKKIADSFLEGCTDEEVPYVYEWAKRAKDDKNMEPLMRQYAEVVYERIAKDSGFLS